MGINAFFTFTIVLGKGVPWSEALGMVFVNGVIFLGAVGDRDPREDHRGHSARPEDRRHVRHRSLHRLHRAEERRGDRGESRHPRSHGNFASGPVALCLLGVILTSILVARRVAEASSSASR
jgi:AGZA family xanthine/uracil permease-like MFS transporter